MPNNMHDSAIMIYYRECLSNLSKFNGGEEYKIFQFINNIERVEKTINANDDILHCMCTAKLDGEAKRWYEDNPSLIRWEQLKAALIERFTRPDSSSKLFEQLKERFRLAGTRDGGDSRNLQQNPSPHFNITSKLSSPIFIAIIDTGSAVTIINQRLLRNIHHKKFIHKQKLHKSANSTAINIIGEVQLEVKIHGYKILILADVATNLVTDLLLGTDWIIENNVIIPMSCEPIQNRRLTA
ncbi:unnamed protein product, partial [Rotaria magnacalcarata]